MSFVFLFSALQVMAYLALALRFVQLGLSPIYRYFVVFMVVEAARLALFAALPRGSDLFAYCYFVSQPVLWVFHALITLEVFQIALRNYPGIATGSRYLIAACLGAAVVLAGATLAVELPVHPNSITLESFLAFERAINVSLLCFVGLLVFGLSWFPVPLTRNALVHAGVFSFFFAAKGALVFSRNLLGPDFNDTANRILLAATLISLALWAAFLTKSGEFRKIKSGYKRSPLDETRLLSQMEAINRTLVGSAKR